MGNCSEKANKEKEAVVVAVNKSHFQSHYVIGKGGFGKVWRVEKKKDRKQYAMKEMSKARILAKRSVNSVLNERKILNQLRHTFIVNMEYCFQDKESLYLVMDLMLGGDLRYHVSRRRTFTEAETKFMIACIVLSLEYIHNNGIIHRDIKPENLVFDAAGYLHITDFGIARIWNPNNAQDTSGTPGYMAPEVMCRSNHGVAADYFAVGVIAYECMLGRRPYQGRNRKEIRDQMLSKQVQVKAEELPKGWSISAANFVSRLLKRKPLERLGVNGPNELKTHPWLKDIHWKDISAKKQTAPFIPNSKQDNFDARSINQVWKDDEELVKQNTLLLGQPSVQALFNGYYFDHTIQVSSPQGKGVPGKDPAAAHSQITADTTNGKAT